MIIGNKNDLEDQRVITKAEGESFTQKVGDDVIFMETSAKNNTNIDKVKTQTESYIPELLSIFPCRYSRTW